MITKSIRAYKGFTLIELLVVISIIALLIGLLLPALGMARRASRSAACKSNLRQIGVGFESYANVYKGMWPNIDEVASVFMRTRNWIPADDPFMPKPGNSEYYIHDVTVFVCPQHISDDTELPSRYEVVKQTGECDVKACSYGMNIVIYPEMEGRELLRYQSVQNEAGRNHGNHAVPAELADPAKTIYMMDAAIFHDAKAAADASKRVDVDIGTPLEFIQYDLYKEGGLVSWADDKCRKPPAPGMPGDGTFKWSYDTNHPDSPTVGAPHFRHPGDSANGLFLDGHVEKTVTEQWNGRWSDDPVYRWGPDCIWDER